MTDPATSSVPSQAEAPVDREPTAQVSGNAKASQVAKWVMGLAIGVFVMGVFVVYPPLSLLAWFTGQPPGPLAILAVTLLPVVGRLAWQWRPGLPTRVLSAVSFTWLGIWFGAWPLLVAADLGLIVAEQLSVDVNRVAVGLILLVTIAAGASYAFANALRPQVRRVPLAGHNKATGRLVQLSDVHIGSRFSGLLARVVRQANAEQPTLHLITGDLVDFRDIPRSELAALAQLNAPAYFVIGNHERYVDCDDICARLTSLGVHVLRNDSATHGDFHLLGIDDADRRDQVARHLPALSLRPDHYQVLLYHRPDGLDAAAAAGVDLMLTGHTHQGQIFPFNFIVKRVFANIAGRYDQGATTLYVSCGTGTWGPILRFGSTSEVTVFDIR